MLCSYSLNQSILPILLYYCYTVQDVSMFSEEEIKKFQKRLENGYDLQQDPKYNLWLSSQTESHDTPISKTCETDKSKKCK